MCKSYTFNFARDCFEKRGYVLVSTEYKDVKKKLEFICPMGHNGEMSLEVFNRGNDCILCKGQKMSKKLRLPYDFVKNEFEKNGYILLSKEYINYNQKLDFICPEGHNGKIAFGNFSNGQRCRICSFISSSEKQKLPYYFVKEQFEKRGYVLLSKEYINNMEKLEYLCPSGHIGTIRYGNFSQGAGCDQCDQEYKVGKNHPMWNDSFTEEQRLEIVKKRGNFESKQWRRNVLERDGYRCQHCGLTNNDFVNKDGRIAAHHIFSFRDNENLRYDIFNGITFCGPCHCLFHSIFGNRNNDPNQINEFLFSIKPMIENIKKIEYKTQEEKIERLNELREELNNKNVLVN